MKTKPNRFQARMFCAVALGIGSSLSMAAEAEDSVDIAPGKTSIPWSQIGADYQGDGLAVIPTSDGARLRCIFQKMEGEVTREGLWLTSTVTNEVNGRFRIVAAAVGRARNVRSSGFSRGPSESFQSSGLTAAEPDEAGTPNHPLERTGTVQVADKLARFVRPGLTEEYSVSMDGVRQDFIIEQRPDGEGPLSVELAVTGAKVEPLANGAQLVLENSGRKIAYSRLRVTDATGKELTAWMEVASGILSDVRARILPPGVWLRIFRGLRCKTGPYPPGWKLRLYGRQGCLPPRSSPCS